MRLPFNYYMNLSQHINNHNGMKRIRNSNIELLRIVAIVIVVLFHCRNGVQHQISGTDASIITKSLFHLLTSWGILGVYSFVAISAYFMMEVKEVHWQKIRTILLQTAFYLILFSCISLYDIGFSIEKLLTFLKEHILEEPLFISNYWYVSAFVGLYVSLPMINAIKLDKRIFWLSYLILYISAFPEPNFFVDYVSFVCAYIIMKFSFENYNNFLEKYSLVLFFVLTGMLYVIPIMHSYFNADSLLIERLFFPIQRHCPFVVVDALCLFYIFKKITLNHSSINYIASFAFGIYLFHECSIFNVNMFLSKIFIVRFGALESLLLTATSCIFGGIIVEAMRRIIFSKIGLEKR